MTSHPAQGLGGPATVLSVVARPGRVAALEWDLQQLASGGFRTTSRLTSVH